MGRFYIRYPGMDTTDGMVCLKTLRDGSRGFRYVLRMIVHRLPFRALFARNGQGWKEGRGDQAMTWHGGMEKM